MRLRYRVVGALLLAAVGALAVYRIAAARNEAFVGGWVFPLEAPHEQEVAAFHRLRFGLEDVGDRAFSERLERMRADGGLWVAPALGRDTWAVFVDNLRLVRRVYVGRRALMDPRAHLREGSVGGPSAAAEQALSFLLLAGGLRREVARYDGHTREEAYEAQIAGYEGLRRTWLPSLAGESRAAWNWALEAAVAAARSARAAPSASS